MVLELFISTMSLVNIFFFRNFDQTTLKVIMDMFREYVPKNEYFPTVKEVTDFKNEFWEEKILKTEMLEENVFTYLKPEGMISMRLLTCLLL